MNIFVCYRPNHILKALLYSFYNGNKEDYFIIGTGEVKDTDVLAMKIKALGYKVYTVNYICLQKNIIQKNKYIKTIFNLFKSQSISKKYINFDLNILNNTKKLFLFQDQNFLAHYFINECYIKNIEINLIEDGAGNYLPKQNGKNKIKLLSGILPNGYNRKIKNVYLFQPNLYKGFYKNKIKLLKNKYLSFTFNDNFNDLLKDLFNIENMCFNNDLSYTFILTQPLQTIGISEIDQIEIYKKIASNYKNKVILKIHPQDNIDYSNIFKNTIDGLVPFELILNSIPRESKIVSLFSASSSYQDKFIHYNIIDPFSKNKKDDILTIIKESK
jgi:hypothetical protein